MNQQLWLPEQIGEGMMTARLADVGFYRAVLLGHGTTAYKNLHAWMQRMYPKTGRCEWCAATDRRTTYAIGRGDGYTRNRADWLELCNRCHNYFDGRDVAPGEANPAAKLTEDDVRQIRALRVRGHTTKSLSERFGVSQRVVQMILRRTAWAHVT